MCVWLLCVGCSWLGVAKVVFAAGRSCPYKVCSISHGHLWVQCVVRGTRELRKCGFGTTSKCWHVF